MTDLQRRLIFILVIELIQAGVSGWCWWMTRGRWRRATDEHSQYVEGDATHPPMNDAGAEILRVRVERYAGWMGIHLWYFFGGMFASLGRVVTIISADAPGVAVTASRDLQILVGAVLMFRMMAKDDFSRKRVSRMDDAEAIRRMAVQAAGEGIVQAQATMQSGVVEMSAKLDEMKDQQTETAQELAKTTTAEALAVRSRLEAATRIIGMSANELQSKLDDTARTVSTKAVTALDEQTGHLIDTIESAKEYTAEKAHEAFREANSVNVKIENLQKINEEHGAILKQLLDALKVQATIDRDRE